MYDCFIFDFDGVLVDTTQIQIESIVAALKIYGFDVKNPNDLDIVSSTITTRSKLIKFCDKGVIRMDQVEDIYTEKKKIANQMMLSLNPASYLDKIEMFQFLKSENKRVSIVTNANGESTRMLLNHLGFIDYIDVLVTNNDVTNSKPHPEPYIRALMQLSRLGAELDTSIIFEDSEVGIASARATGALVYEVKCWTDVNRDLVSNILGTSK